MSESVHPPTPPAANAKAKSSKRHPLERTIVWGGILAMLAVVALEAHARMGYSATVSRMKQEFGEEDDPTSKLSHVRGFISGFPSESSTNDRSYRNMVFKWPSLIHDYRVHLVVEAEGDDPIVLGFTTPNAAEPELPPEVSPAAASPTNPNQTSAQMAARPTASRPGAGAGPSRGGPGGGPGSGPGGPRGGRGGGGQGRLNLLSLAQRKEVGTELKLTEDQLKKLADLAKEGQGAFQGLRSIPEEERAAKMKEMREKQEQSVQGAIEETQFTRLRQLFWRESGMAVFDRDDAAVAIGLSDEQREKLKVSFEERQKEMRGMREAAPADVTAKRAEWDEKLRGHLTPEQLTKWEELLGAPLVKAEETPEAKPPAAN